MDSTINRTRTPFVEVCFPLPLDNLYTYRVPDDVVDRVGIGKRVVAPFSNKFRAGFVVGLDPRPPANLEIKELSDIPDEDACFDEPWWQFIIWTANYYMTPIGLALKTAIPSGFERKSERWAKFSTEGRIWLEGLKAPDREQFDFKLPRDGSVSYKKLVVWIGKKLIEEAIRMGFLNIEERIAQIRSVKHPDYKTLRDPFLASAVIANHAPQLTSDQQSASQTIIESINRGGFTPHLLFGVTGSGKTEVYLKSIDTVIGSGRRALMLVPEIGLTPQSAELVLRRFGDNISLFHSGITEAQKALEWRKIIRGDTKVVVATRSGIFTPIPDLGLIVVDEEHDSSYKQEDGCPYNARDLALARGKLTGICVVLGSATPSFETFVNAEKGKINRIDISTRYHGEALPTVSLVDLKLGGKAKNTSKSFLTEPLVKAIKETLDKKKQTVLFLNRRGFDTFAQCQECGQVFRCPNCDVSLTHHKNAHSLKCHLCGFAQSAPPLCPKCSSSRLYFSGIGTQKVEEDLSKLFPQAQIERFDRDSTSKKNQLQGILKRFRDRSIDILVGTQMIVKGHDFPGIALVGILFGDASLNFPDFRASEKTFQLLTQVAGRTGRDMDPGQVILQTFDTEHEVIRLSAKHSYEEFFEQESELRKELSYPPYGHLVLIKIQGTNEKRVQEKALAISSLARSLKDATPEVMILGPAPCPRKKLVGKFRWQVILKGRARSSVRHLAELLIEHGITRAHTVRVTIDVDPVDLM